MTTWTYTFGELRRRPGRTILTLSGVAIGVAVLVAAGTAIDAARIAYRDLFDFAGSAHSLEIVAPGADGFDPHFAGGIAATPGVRLVCPRIIATSALADFSGSVSTMVLGLPPDSAAAIPAFSIHLGEGFRTGDGIWLDERTALARGWAAGATVTLLTPLKEVELPLLGIVRPIGSMGISGSSVVYLPLATAQRLFALPDRVNSVEVILAEGADVEEVRRLLEPQLPTGLRFQQSSRRGDLSHSTLMAVQHGLTALSLVALVAAGFVVLNTVRLNLTERRKQLAILRTLGATTAQLRRLLLREALLLGMAGSMLGTGVGLLLALGLTRAMQGFLSISLPHPEVSLWLTALALLAGPGLTFLATVTATRQAVRQKPIHDLVNPAGASSEASAGRGQVVGLLLVAVSALLEIGLCRGWLSPSAGPLLQAPAVALLLAGWALCLPLLVAPVLRLLERCPKKMLGIVGRLALGQLLRRPARTALTSGILFIAVASAVGFGHFLLNTLRDLQKWYGNAIVADFLVRGSVPDSSFLLTAPVPEKFEYELAAIAGVERIDKVSFINAEVSGRPALVLARTFAEDRPLTLDLREGEPDQIRRGLMRGEVVVASGLAQRLSTREGDTITLDSRRGPVDLRVAGVVTEYAVGGDALYMDWATAKDLIVVPGVHVFLITARPGAREELQSQLQVFCYRHQLMLQSNADLRGHIDKLLERISASLWIIVALTFVVASLGVINTLTMNVIEQSRDLSVMRAIGASSAQTRGLVIGQAFILALVSLGLGAVAGVGLAALINESANAVFGQQVEFHVIPLLTVGCFLVGVAITTIAASLPAAQAVRFAAIASIGKG